MGIRLIMMPMQHVGQLNFYFSNPHIAQEGEVGLIILLVGALLQDSMYRLSGLSCTLLPQCAASHIEKSISINHS